MLRRCTTVKLVMAAPALADYYAVENERYEVAADGFSSYGPDDAPVTIVEFSPKMPIVFINDRPVVSAVPFDEIAAVILQIRRRTREVSIGKDRF